MRSTLTSLYYPMCVMRPRLLDLFCCAGGAAMGYERAGFDVLGVDIVRQPNFPFEFHRQDAMAVLELLCADVSRFGPVDAIHASPPCQRYSPLAARHPEREYPDLVGPVRRLLRKVGLPYVIENVPGAPLHRAVGLCGSMFGLGAGGRYLKRHRLFECSFPASAPSGCRHRGEAIGVYGSGGAWQAQVSAIDMEPRGGYQGTIEERREAMQIDWMTRDELAEAIPPAYTEHIGIHLRNAL